MIFTLQLLDIISFPLFSLLFLLVVSSFFLLTYFRKSKNVFYLINAIIGFVLVIPKFVFLILYSLDKGKITQNQTSLIIYSVFYILSFSYSFLGSLILFCIGYRDKIKDSLFIKSINFSPWKSYLMLGKRDKVLKMSDDLLEEIGIKDFNQVKNKKLFDFLFQKIRMLTINGKTIDNQRFYEKYLDFKKNIKEDSKTVVKISFYNSSGNEVYLYILLQPIFSLKRYKGLIINGEIKSSFDIMSLENKFEKITSDYSQVNDKFIALLEVSDAFFIFYDLSNKILWASSSLIKELNLPDNTLAMKDYYRLMHEEDLINYNAEISQLTKERPTYNIRYRMYLNGAYVWFREKGKKIFQKDNISIIAEAKKINSKHFIKSELPILDDLDGHIEMEMEITKLLEEQVYFQLIYFKIGNLKEINENYSRDVGNMVLAEYVLKLSKTFVSDDTKLFRITGSTFALVLTDPKKMEILKNGLIRNDDYLDLAFKFGAVDIKANVFAGAATSKKDSNNKTELIRMANNALKFALSPKYKGNICYYSDIK